ncbi:MAG: hypothetical protein WCG04_06345, partial [Alphaproteobacteria bacterium]
SHLMEEVLSRILPYRDGEQIRQILDLGFVAPQKLLENMCISGHFNHYIEALLQRGARLESLHPATGEPIAFLLLNCYYDVGELNPGLLGLRNKEGLTLLQAMQKAHLEKNEIASLFNSLQYLLTSTGGDYVKESYPPFIEHFGGMKQLPYYGNIRTRPANQAWIAGLQSAQNPAAIQELMDTCPDVQLLELFHDKIITQGIDDDAFHQTVQTRNAKERERDDRARELRGLLAQPNPDFEALQKHIGPAPTRDVLLTILELATLWDLHETMLWFLQNYDFSEVIDAVKLRLRDKRWYITPRHAAEYLQVYYNKAPHQVDEILDSILQSSHINDECFDQILALPFINPQKVLENMCARVGEGVKYTNIDRKFAALFKKGVNLLMPDPRTGEPIAWAISKIEGNIAWDALNAYPDQVALLDLKNQEGLTLLQAMQKYYFEESKPAALLSPLHHLSSIIGRNHSEAYYPPFFDYFGSMNYLPDCKNLRDENQAWIAGLQSARNPDEVQALIDNCPDVQLLHLFRTKIMTHFPHMMDHGSRAVQTLTTKQDAWAASARAIIEQPQPDLAALKEHLDVAPTREALKQILGSLLDDRFVDLLPDILARLYPEREMFTSEKQLPSLGNTHPIIYALQKGAKLTANALVDFLGGIENISLVVAQFSNDHDIEMIMQHLPEEHLEYLYKINPAFFTETGRYKNDHFAISPMYLPLMYLPLKLKRQVALENIAKIKEVDREHNPYFWHLLGENENLPLVQELLTVDPSLLLLQTSDGFGLESLLTKAPKSKMVDFIKGELRKIA